LEKAAIRPGDTVVVLGQGPIGLLFTMLLARTGGETLYATDVLPLRLEKAQRLGAREAWDPTKVDVRAELLARTAGRGADVVIVAASAPGIVEEAMRITRPGARIMLFAQTSPKETFQLDGAQIGKDERMVFGSYSASVDLQRESAEAVWSDSFLVEELISHELPLDELERGMELARRPQDGSLKVLVHPQR
jgi:L-iditol 2-dehydrogenase